MVRRKGQGMQSQGSRSPGPRNGGALRAGRTEGGAQGHSVLGGRNWFRDAGGLGAGGWKRTRLTPKARSVAGVWSTQRPKKGRGGASCLAARAGRRDRGQRGGTTGPLCHPLCPPRRAATSNSSARGKGPCSEWPAKSRPPPPHDLGPAATHLAPAARSVTVLPRWAGGRSRRRNLGRTRLRLQDCCLGATLSFYWL
jgi:hypothetical protein